jgi:8-oxo-dGTP diphosphatase
MAIKRIKNYPKKGFAHAVVAVDVVIFTVINHKLNVLLLELNEDPFSGRWALPGGLVTKSESLDESVKRHLETKAGVAGIYFEQLYTFGEPNRDPKGWVVSVAYMALVNRVRVHPKTSDRYRNIAWKDVNNLPEMAYDHKLIVKIGIERLRSKLTYTNIIYSLMPREFSYTELQQMYESILEEKLDKRNFRKKIDSLGLLTKLNKKRKGEPSRPAQLYSFKSRTPKIVEIL